MKTTNCKTPRIPSADQEAINEVRAARVLRSDFKPVALVGRGQFGKVELVRVREGPSDSVYALKTIPKKIASDSVMVSP